MLTVHCMHAFISYAVDSSIFLLTHGWIYSSIIIFEICYIYNILLDLHNIFQNQISVSAPHESFTIICSYDKTIKVYSLLLYNRKLLMKGKFDEFTALMDEKQEITGLNPKF